jgi:hypothetical protein
MAKDIFLNNLKLYRFERSNGPALPFHSDTGGMKPQVRAMLSPPPVAEVGKRCNQESGARSGP